jgi:predicted nucleotide-binding protein (sugar kinase/HSP70/actin superfamily)
VYKGIGSGKLAKKLFWTTGRSQFDALEWMLKGQDGEPDGFIQIAPFACGPEAIVSDMLERRIKSVKKPYLKIYYEEHSGEAGIITRLEAFIDLLKYQHIAC